MRSERWIIPKQILEGILVKYQGTADIPPKEYDFWDTISTFFADDVRPGDQLKWGRYKFPESRTLKRAIEQNTDNQYAGVNIEKKRGYSKSDGELLLDILCLYAFGIDWDSTLNEFNIPDDSIYKHKKGIKLQSFVHANIVLEETSEGEITEEEAQTENEVIDVIEEISNLICAKRYSKASNLVDSAKEKYEFSEFEERVIKGFEAIILIYYLKNHREGQSIMWDIIEYFTNKKVEQNVAYYSFVLADSLRQTGDYVVANVLINRCIKFYKKSKIDGYRTAIVYLYLTSAESCMLQGNFTESATLLNKANQTLAKMLVENNGVQSQKFRILSALVDLFRGKQALYTNNDFPKAIIKVEEAISVFKDTNNDYYAAISTELLVRLYFYSKTLLQKRELIAEAIQDLEEYELYSEMVVCLSYLFMFDFSSKINNKTFEDYFEKDDLLAKCKSDIREYYMYSYLKHYNQMITKDYDGAKETAQKLIINGRTHKITEDILDGHLLYFNVYYSQNEVDKVQTEIGFAIDELQEIKRLSAKQFLIPKIHICIAKLYSYNEDYILAIKHFELAKPGLNKNEELEIEFNIAECYLGKQDYEKARLLFDKIVQTSNQIDHKNNIEYIFKSKLNIGRCYLHLFEHDKARECFLEALEFNKVHGLNNDESIIYFLNKV
jgi:tetratricopeptide (TPR) repeat protein